MEVELGKKGLSNTWQNKFEPEVKCKDCGNIARIAFVVFEKPNQKEYICDLYKNKENSMWPHDATATAVYLCKKCLEPTAIMNQA